MQLISVGKCSKYNYCC